MPRAPRTGDAPPTPEGFTSSDPWDTDVTSLVARTVRRSVAFLRRFGFAVGDGTRGLAPSLVVVEIPERQRLAVHLPGIVAISDHSFRVMPIDRVQRFHADAIARRVYGALVMPHVRAASDPILAPSIVADLDGSLFVDLARIAEAGKRESPKDLIGFAGFHPAVDQLLYAPKIAFQSDFFHDVAERDPDRDGAERARTRTPFGRFYLEKLRDRLGAAAFSRAAREHVDRGIAWSPAAESAYGSLADFFRQWSAPRRLSYGIVGRREERGARIRHVVTVERRGDTWVREPVRRRIRRRSGRARSTNVGRRGRARRGRVGIRRAARRRDSRSGSSAAERSVARDEPSALRRRDRSLVASTDLRELRAHRRGHRSAPGRGDRFRGEATLRRERSVRRQRRDDRARPKRAPPLHPRIRRPSATRTRRSDRGRSASRRCDRRTASADRGFRSPKSISARRSVGTRERRSSIRKPALA